MQALYPRDSNRKNFLPNSKCSAFSIPSCSFVGPPAIVQAEMNDVAKILAVTNELAFGSKIFEYAILHDYNRMVYNLPNLTFNSPFQYKQILIKKILMQNVNIEKIIDTKIRTPELQEHLKYTNIRSNSHLIPTRDCLSHILESAKKITVDSFKQPKLKTFSLYSKNKMGRTYNPGRPLEMDDRKKILELYQKGFKISHISKIIGVTHSCVSKIMTRYRKTGSMRPRCALLSQKCKSSNIKHQH